MSQKDKLQASLIKRFGSEEAVTEWRRRIGREGGAKSRNGGFAANRELAREAGRKGGKNRWKNHKKA